MSNDVTHVTERPTQFSYCGYSATMEVELKAVFKNINHLYKRTWTLSAGEEFSCKQESGKQQGPIRSSSNAKGYRHQPCS